MHTNAEMIFDKYATPLLPAGINVLEAGIGKRFWLSPYIKSAPQRGWVHYFCDYGNFGPDHPYHIHQNGEYSICIGDDTFDAVISQQTLEHVRKPWLLVQEFARVVKPGGLIVMVVPMTWEVHRNPWDCWRIYPDGMRSLINHAGCEEVLVREEHIKDTERERECQWGQVPVRDVIGIARKPGGKK